MPETTCPHFNEVQFQDTRQKYSYLVILHSHTECKKISIVDDNLVEHVSAKGSQTEGPLSRFGVKYLVVHSYIVTGF